MKLVCALRIAGYSSPKRPFFAALIQGGAIPTILSAESKNTVRTDAMG